MHSISYSSPDLKAVTQKLSGEKTIVKALTALVNREGKKKTPVKRVNVSFSESE